MSIAPTIALSLLLVSTAQAGSVELLKDLRTRLDAIRSGPPTTAAEPPPISLTELVGVTRTELLTNLGEPSVCTSGLKPRPCPEAQQWWYSFYKLAPKTFGGGPELAITFSDPNSVSASQAGANTEAASAGVLADGAAATTAAGDRESASASGRGTSASPPSTPGPAGSAGCDRVRAAEWFVTR